VSEGGSRWTRKLLAALPPPGTPLRDRCSRNVQMRSRGWHISGTPPERSRSHRLPDAVRKPCAACARCDRRTTPATTRATRLISTPTKSPVHSSPGYSGPGSIALARVGPSCSGPGGGAPGPALQFSLAPRVARTATREAASHREASTTEHAQSVEPRRDVYACQVSDGSVDEAFHPARRQAEFACQFPTGPRPLLRDSVVPAH